MPNVKSPNKGEQLKAKQMQKELAEMKQKYEKKGLDLTRTSRKQAKTQSS